MNHRTPIFFVSTDIPFPNLGSYREMMMGTSRVSCIFQWWEFYSKFIKCENAPPVCTTIIYSPKNSYRSDIVNRDRKVNFKNLTVSRLTAISGQFVGEGSTSLTQLD